MFQVSPSKRVEYGECKLTPPLLSFTKHYSQRLFNIHILILHNRFADVVTRNFGRIFVLISFASLWLYAYEEGEKGLQIEKKCTEVNARECRIDLRRK